MLKTIKVKVEVEVPFHSYGTEAKDARAVGDIRRWIKSSLTRECSYIPLYVDKDDSGATIEDSTSKTKVKLK